VEEEYCRAITWVVGGHAAANHFLSVLSLDLKRLPLFILKLTICVLVLDLGKTRLAPGLKKCNQCAGPGECVYINFQTRLSTYVFITYYDIVVVVVLSHSYT